MRDKKVFKIALGGICLTLTVAFMFGASFVPGVELTLYAISSLFVAIMIVETDVRGGIALFAAAILLGFLIVPNKVGVLPYACLFGLYGIIKYYIEKLKSPVGQILLKVCFFGVVLTVVLVFFKALLLGNINLPDFPVPVIIVAGVAFLMLYDAIYTYLINLYLRRIKRIHIPDIKVDQQQEDE